LIGCGTAVIAGMGTGATSVDILGIATAFGLTIVAMAYGIGQVSGCHINPAVSFGVLVAGRMTTQDFITYVIAQVLGAIAGAVVLISSSQAKRRNGMADSARTAGDLAILASTIWLRPSSMRWSPPSYFSSASSVSPRGARRLALAASPSG
jgi:glycerol uptake facilitator-like aquaporin